MRPGNRVFAHIFPVPTNMKTGRPRFGSIGISLAQVAWNQIWRTLFGIPTMNGGNGPSDSKQIDFQIAYEKSMGLLLSAISGASWINAIGGLTGELSYHPVQSVLDNDVAGAIVRFLQGVTVTDETLAIDLINQVGPVPGFYLDKIHTMRWWKKETFEGHAVDLVPYEEWEKTGRKTALDLARERSDQLLAEWKPVLDVLPGGGPRPHPGRGARVLPEAGDGLSPLRAATSARQAGRGAALPEGLAVACHPNPAQDLPRARRQCGL